MESGVGFHEPRACSKAYGYHCHEDQEIVLFKSDISVKQLLLQMFWEFCIN